MDPGTDAIDAIATHLTEQYGECLVINKADGPIILTDAVEISPEWFSGREAEVWARRLRLIADEIQFKPDLTGGRERMLIYDDAVEAPITTMATP